MTSCSVSSRPSRCSARVVHARVAELARATRWSPSTSVTVPSQSSDDPHERDGLREHAEARHLELDGGSGVDAARRRRPPARRGGRRDGASFPPRRGRVQRPSRNPRSGPGALLAVDATTTSSPSGSSSSASPRAARARARSRGPSAAPARVAPSASTVSPASSPRADDAGEPRQERQRDTVSTVLRTIVARGPMIAAGLANANAA